MSYHWPADTDEVLRAAYEIGVRFGMSALDALHVAAAISAGAEEFVTTERPKAMYKPRFHLRWAGTAQRRDILAREALDERVDGPVTEAPHRLGID